MSEPEIILQSRPVQENEFLYGHNTILSFERLEELFEYISSKTHLSFEPIERKNLIGNYNYSHGIRVIEND
jgi:hypothetical protein